MPSLKEKKELVWSKAGVGAGSGAAVAADTVEHTTWAGDRRYNTTANHQPQPPTCPVLIGVSGDVERCAWTEGMGPSGHQQSCLRPCIPLAVGTQNRDRC